MELRDLKKVENELLIQLEDFLLDNMFDFKSLTTLTDEERETFSTSFLKKLIDRLRENPIEIAKIVFCDERGHDIPEDELRELPIKLELVKKALPHIMEVLLGSLSDEQGEQELGKPQAKTRARVIAKS
tara:strand:+ start:2598 stop:2984 length:387 start_codon:yes stop_codon:yes gene_type:complete